MDSKLLSHVGIQLICQNRSTLNTHIRIEWVYQPSFENFVQLFRQLCNSESHARIPLLDICSQILLSTWLPSNCSAHCSPYGRHGVCPKKPTTAVIAVCPSDGIQNLSCPYCYVVLRPCSLLLPATPVTVPPAIATLSFSGSVGNGGCDGSGVVVTVALARSRHLQPLVFVAPVPYLKYFSQTLQSARYPPLIPMQSSQPSW
jgi:hypothetical protein